MPFQSEKQRRYMHANLPDIANRWEAKYGLGGIAELNQQLNSLPEYYLPKNQGGFIPSHEAGIYGLAEGGNIRLQPHTASDLLVQKTLSGERPKYQPPGHVDAPSRSSDRGGHSQHATTNVTSRPVSTPSYQSVHDTGAVSQTPGRTPKTTTSTGGDKPFNIHQDTGEEEEAYVIVGGKKVHQPKWGTQEDPREQIQLRGDEDLETIAEIEKENALRKLKFDRNTLTKNEIKNLEVGLGLRPAKKAFNPLKWILGGAAIIGSGGAALGFGGSKIVQAANLINKVNKVTTQLTDAYNMFHKTDFTREELFHKIQDNAKQVKEIHQKKKDLYESFADTPNHPERIALQAELEIGKKTTPKDGPDREGGVTQDTSITIDNIEEVNDDKTQLLRKYQEMEWASSRAQLEQQEMQAKKEAYLKNFRQMYMSAQGGRVPAGYNTGGLSNLFRLKNV